LHESRACFQCHTPDRPNRLLRARGITAGLSPKRVCPSGFCSSDRRIESRSIAHAGDSGPDACWFVVAALRSGEVSALRPQEQHAGRTTPSGRLRQGATLSASAPSREQRSRETLVSSLRQNPLPTHGHGKRRQPCRHQCSRTASHGVVPRPHEGFAETSGVSPERPWSRDSCSEWVPDAMQKWPAPRPREGTGCGLASSLRFGCAGVPQATGRNRTLRRTSTSLPPTLALRIG
jgi:hypothetical protein